MNEHLDPKYLEYLQGKRIALVGPASYLLKIEIGDLINSYDIVVRVNRGLELIDGYPKNLGTKTNILYNCGIKTPANGGDLNIDFYKSNNIQWVSTVPNSDIKGNCPNNSLHGMVDSHFIKEAKKHFNFHLMDFRIFTEVSRNVKCRANTGFAAIFDLLAHQVSELFVCGYSFYLDPFIKGYKDGCKRNEEEFSKQCFVSKRHIQANQWAYLKKVFGKEKKLTADPVLSQILNMDKLSREKFGQIS